MKKEAIVKGKYNKILSKEDCPKKKLSGKNLFKVPITDTKTTSPIQS